MEALFAMSENLARCIIDLLRRDTRGKLMYIWESFSAVINVIVTIILFDQDDFTMLNKLCKGRVVEEIWPWSQNSSANDK